MKILFINSTECDYAQDTTYSALVEIFGKENVFDFPLFYRFHFPRKVYPRNLGYISTGLLKRLFSSQKNFELVVMSSCNHYSAQYYNQIIRSIPSYVPIVFIDGGDQGEIGGDFLRLKSKYSFEYFERIRPFDLIFKREYLKDKKYESRVHPYPFSARMDIYQKLNNNSISTSLYDVSFWAVESHPIRTAALNLIENQFDCAANGTTRNQKFRKYKRKGSVYLKEIKNCKITLNFRGAGWDTLRYWEVPALQSFLISQKPGIVIPNDFVDKESIVHCKEDLSDLLDLCRYYLQAPEERVLIANKAYQHVLKYHTHVKRAEYLLEKVNSLKTKK